MDDKDREFLRKAKKDLEEGLTSQEAFDYTSTEIQKLAVERYAATRRAEMGFGQTSAIDAPGVANQGILCLWSSQRFAFGRDAF